MAFKDMASLMAALETQIDSAIQNEVADDVRMRLAESAEEFVYDAYTPKKYDRRGSLKDISQIESESTGSMSVAITPVAEFSQNPISENSGNELAGLVEYGDGWNGYNYEYHNRKGSSFAEPRPYISRLCERMQDSDYLTLITMDYLSDKGIKVK